MSDRHRRSAVPPNRRRRLPRTAAPNDYTNLTVNGLIRVTIALPANVGCSIAGRPFRARRRPSRPARPSPRFGGRFPPSSTSTSRAPTALSRTTRAGRTSAAAPSSTRASTRCRTRRSARSSATRPSAWPRLQSFLDDIAGFEKTQFSSASVEPAVQRDRRGRRARCRNPDPVLNDLETAGKSVSSTGRARSATATWAAIRAPPPQSSRAWPVRPPPSSATTTS